MKMKFRAVYTSRSLLEMDSSGGDNDYHDGFRFQLIKKLETLIWSINMAVKYIIIATFGAHSLLLLFYSPYFILTIFNNNYSCY